MDGLRPRSGTVPRTSGQVATNDAALTHASVTLRSPFGAFLSGFHDADLNHGDEAIAFLQQGKVVQYATVQDQHKHICQLASLQRGDLVSAT